MHGQISVLHVDDQSDVLDLSKQLFTRTDDRVSTITADSGEKGMAALANQEVDCIVSDSIQMADGESFVEAASRETDAPIVLFTAKEWRNVVDDALAANVSEYVRKADPSDYQTVLRHVLRLTATSDQERQLIGKHDFRSRTELAVSIVEAVGTYTDRDSDELNQLYDAVDADALEKLFAPSAGLSRAEHTEACFTYEGLTLVVTGNGAIYVIEPSLS